MPNYKRLKTGNMFFFTVVTDKRRPVFGDGFCRGALGRVMREVKALYPFYNEAFVLMSDHIHCIWSLPDADYSMRWGLIKKELAKMVRADSGRWDGDIWQKRFWEHTIRDDRDFENHCHYIHYNPVKHGYVDYPYEWEFSSFHRFVKQGRYNRLWCASGVELEGMERESDIVGK